MGGHHLHKNLRFLTPGIYPAQTSACTRSVAPGEVPGRAIALRLGREQAFTRRWDAGHQLAVICPDWTPATGLQGPGKMR